MSGIGHTGPNGRVTLPWLIAGVILLAGACDLAPGSGGSPTPAARDYCAELGFVDGEQRGDGGELVAECRSGPTPNGGAYSIARYNGNRVEITEYDAEGNILQTTHGTVGDD